MIAAAGETWDDPDAAIPEYQRLGRRLSNWGRWGADDEIGTVNFITDERRAASARLVESGAVVPLSLAFDDRGPQSGSGARFNPVHTMTMLLTDGDWAGGMMVADDEVTMPLQCATHWDALAHMGYDGATYNGVPASDMTAESGAIRNSIVKVADRLVGRGVLIDIPRLRGVGRLGPSEEVTASELADAEQAQGVRVGPGDIVFVRTGWSQHLSEGDRATYLSQVSPGLGMSCCEWLSDRDVAAVAADTFAVEVRPSRDPAIAYPVHMVLLRDMGMTLGEMFQLEELAIQCAANDRWEFFFVGVPLKFTGAVGAPLEALAIM